MARVLIFLLVIVGTCCAGLRETRDELIARYGQARADFSGKDAGEPLAEEVLAFVMLSSLGEGRHIAILAYLSDGKCEEIRYNPNDFPKFSESEIEVLRKKTEAVGIGSKRHHLRALTSFL
jgi:hypothetical protein